MSPARTAGLLLLMVAGASPGLAAQQDPVGPQEEARLLREASGFEWQGKVDEAISTLEDLLDRKPDSSGGLFALERILRGAERVREVLPRADRFLEVDPSASGPRYLKLRVLVEIDSLGALDAAARAWFRAEPGSPDPYREVARLYERAYGPERALDVLRRGREALDRDDALALETGDLLAETGDQRGAVREWAAALADPQTDVSDVLERLEGLKHDDPGLAEPVVEALMTSASSAERRKAAVAVALSAGPERAIEVAGRILDGLDGSRRSAFLDQVAQLARERQAPKVSLWALEGLQSTSAQDDQSSAQVQARMAAAALAAGDTAEALAAQTRLARSLEPGSAERRRVVADLVRLEAGSADAVTLEQRLEGFRREFPEAPEADGLLADVAARLAARGQVDEALELIDQVLGPRSQLERAWLYFEQGDVARGREALEAALPALAPAEATEALQLLTSLDRVVPATGAALALAAATVHHGAPATALSSLDAALTEAPEADLAPLHARAARVALTLGDTATCESHLRYVVDEATESPEAPEAFLLLARLRAASPDGVQEARALLEKLIVAHPQAAVVPAARRELDRLGRG